MAISNFRIPTGLEVSGTTILTGTLDVSQNVNVTSLTASVGISGTVGNFATLNVTTLSAPSLNLAGDLTVSGNVNLGDGVGANTVTVRDALTASAGLQVSASNLTVLGDISGSGTLQAGGAATLADGLTVTGLPLNASAVAVSASALNVTNDISARSASLTGDLTVGGNLSVKGQLTYIDSTTVNIGDRNVSLATGSTTIASLDTAGIDLGDAQQVQWYYNHASTAWTSNVDLNVSASKVYKVAGTTALGGGTLGATSGIYLTSGSLISPTNPGKLTITSNGSSSLSASSEINLVAPKVFVGSPLATSASLVAATSVSVGSVSTVATAINGATTTIVGINALFLTGANVYITGNTYFNNDISGTKAQFTTITGSTVTGSTALFTTISGSDLSASTSVIAPTLIANVLVASDVNTLNIAGGGTSTVDTFTASSYSAAKYVIKAKDNTTSEVHVLEALVATDGAVALLTPYASTYTGASALITLSSSYSGGDVTVSALNNSATQVTVKFLKSYIA